MSQKNDENTMIAFGFAVIVAAIAVAALFLMALMAFVALIFTVLCLCALDEPLKIWRVTIHPHEARAFLLRGVAGAVLLPVFILFCAVLFSLDVNWNYLVHIILVGYSLGSVGVEILMADIQDEDADPPATLPHAQVSPPEPQRALPAPPHAPFGYASWDDEEAQE